MVYLVRTIRMLKFDDGIMEKTKDMMEHIRKTYPQIKDMKFLWNVTGPIDESHWVVQFDSLADEDDWAQKIINDEKYLNWMRAAEGILTPGVDRLYRESPM